MGKVYSKKQSEVNDYMESVNEYLEFCKVNGLNPMEERNLTNFKKSKVKRAQPKDITLEEIFKGCKETIRLENAEHFKERVVSLSKSYKLTTEEATNKILEFIFKD